MDKVINQEIAYRRSFKDKKNYHSDYQEWLKKQLPEGLHPERASQNLENIEIYNRVKEIKIYNRDDETHYSAMWTVPSNDSQK